MKLKQLGANQTELHMDNGVRVLFSYQTPVAAIKGEKGFYTARKWSRTTTRHVKQWTCSQENLNVSWQEEPQPFFDVLAACF